MRIFITLVLLAAVGSGGYLLGLNDHQRVEFQCPSNIPSYQYQSGFATGMEFADDPKKRGWE